MKLYSPITFSIMFSPINSGLWQEKHSFQKNIFYHRNVFLITEMFSNQNVFAISSARRQKINPFQNCSGNTPRSTEMFPTELFPQLFPLRWASENIPFYRIVSPITEMFLIKKFSYRFGPSRKSNIWVEFFKAIVLFTF